MIPNCRYTQLGEAMRPASTIQSHTYEPHESPIYRAHLAQRHCHDEHRWWTTRKQQALRRWALTFAIGVATACVGYAINVCTKALSGWKFRAVRRVLAERGAFSALVVFAIFNACYVALASLAVYVEPVAAGSGIPEVKCYLNGIDVPRVVRLRTLLCKAGGVLFSVAAGLPVGKEGPMIHSGSAIAASLARAHRSGRGGKAWAVDAEIRSDRETRDFVACGAAAGVAAAFGAPIGGVLFSLEEGASFWSTKLTWRSFFCAMMTKCGNTNKPRARARWRARGTHGARERGETPDAQ